MGDLDEFYGPEGFCADAVEPQEDFEPIPPGWYYAVLEKAEPKPTKAGTGSYMNCQYSILGPQEGGEQFNNRKVFGTITLKNPNQQAMDIGARQMSALCRAVNVMRPHSTEELCNIPFLLRVKIEAKQGFEPKNAPTSWKSIEEAKQEKQQAKPAQHQNQAAPPTGQPNNTKMTLPWHRKTEQQRKMAPGPNTVTVDKTHGPSPF